MAAKKLGLDKADIALQTTLMTIREELMVYFKGSCVERLTQNQNIQVRPLRQDGNYYYERRQADNKNTHRLALAGIPILTIQMSPDMVVFHTGVFQRSKQFRALEKQLRKFFYDFLPSVTVEANDKEIYHAT